MITALGTLSARILLEKLPLNFFQDVIIFISGLSHVLWSILSSRQEENIDEISSKPFRANVCLANLCILLGDLAVLESVLYCFY